MNQGQPEHDVCVSSAVSQGTTVSPRAASSPTFHLSGCRDPSPEDAEGLPAQQPAGGAPQPHRGAPAPTARLQPQPRRARSPRVPAASLTQPRQRCRRSQHG